MNKDDFKRILLKFADNPADIIEERGEFLININGIPINVKVKKSGSGIVCIENGGIEVPAKKWIIERLGNLKNLASFILEKIPNDNNLISVSATLSSYDLSFGDEQKYSNAVKALSSQIENRYDYSTDVIYLTSEAGEGKTCVMNALARKQAELYLDGKSEWLFIPIALSGRPFLRLDEIIIGTLANYYRFRGYYFESFIELMKLDSIVLGLDGFEEMTIEGAEGDVVSSLGNLLNGLNSEGTMVFAARKAYYNYTNLKSQAKLFDSFRTKDVVFSELYLDKWSKIQFCSLLETYGFNKIESEKYYLILAKELSPEHPILTRAVLARKLAEEIGNDNGNNISTVISQFKNGHMDEVFSKFVEMLLKREITKWTTKGDLHEPLLTLSQHESIMQLIAEEMWSSNSEKLKEGFLLSLMELSCEIFGMKPHLINQCKERILHHALITLQTDSLYSFCHEEFYLLFLGRHLAQVFLNKSSIFNIRRILDKKVMPQLSVQECCRLINSDKKNKDIIEFILSFSNGIARNSCLSQNLSSILIPLLSHIKDKVTLSGFFCSSKTLSCIPIENIKFNNCIIEKLTLDAKLLKNISFTSCDIIEVSISLTPKCQGIIFDEASLPQVFVSEEGVSTIYDPNTIARKLKKIGIQVQVKIDDSENLDIEEEESLILFFKIVQLFQRSTGLNENVLKTKIGKRWNSFEENTLNPVLTNDIFREIEYKGHDKQRRFRLNRSFSDLANAREKCQGDFTTLIKILNGGK